MIAREAPREDEPQPVDNSTTGRSTTAADCALPCSPTPGDRPPADAIEHLGVTEFWVCPRHGSHSGQRRSLTWWRDGQKYGWWEWSHVR